MGYWVWGGGLGTVWGFPINFVIVFLFAAIILSSISIYYIYFDIKAFNGLEIPILILNHRVWYKLVFQFRLFSSSLLFS